MPAHGPEPPPANPDDEAPPSPGGAYDDINFIAPPVAWTRNNLDQSPDAEDDAVDPDRLPESEGMAEDPVDPPPPSPSLPAPAAPPAARPPEGLLSTLSLDGMGEHLDELRRRIIISLVAFVPLFGAGLYFYQTLWEVVIRPLNRFDRATVNFQALSPSDGLVMAMRIAFAFAFFITLPLLLTQVWHFVAPGLTARERRYVYLSLGSGGLLFVLGAAMAYFFGIPFALDFLLPFNESMEGWGNSFTGTGYVDFVITCCVGFGLAFELPLVMLALALAGLLSAEGLRRWWRMGVLVIFVCAAVMTPPDPFTQLMLALPMCVLLFVGYWLVKWVRPR